MVISTALSASLEDYIEAIYHIVARKRAARAKDIAQRLHVNNSSVTGALHALSERGLVNYAPYDVITLTDEGTTVAKDVVHRHEVLRDFFVRVLSVDAVEAEDAACRMEHAVPATIVERFVRFVEFVDRCPRGGEDWLLAFAERCGGADRGDCERCVQACVDRARDMNQGGERARDANPTE